VVEKVRTTDEDQGIVSIMLHLQKCSVFFMRNRE